MGTYEMKNIHNYVF